MDMLSALRDERAGMMAGARALIEKPGATGDDAAQAESIMARVTIIDSRIKAAERAATYDSEQPVPGIGAAAAADLQRSTFANEIRLIRAYCARPRWASDIHGGDSIAADVRAEWNSRSRQPTNAASNSPGTAGGYTVAPAFVDKLLVAMKQQGAIRSVSDCFTTDTGAVLTWPEMDDRAQSGRLLTTENTTLNAGTDVLFAAASFTAYTFVSDVLVVSNQLMQDSAFGFGDLLVNALASRLVRAESPYLATGTGAGQPQGVLVGAPVGVTGAAGSTTSVTFDNLIDLMHSVDPAYRPGAVYMMNDATLQAVRKLKDANGRYLWQASEAADSIATVGGMIYGHPVVVNSDFPTMGANAVSIAFGNFQAGYKIRTVQDVRLQMLTERYADSNSTGFICSMRTDAKIASAAAPIKTYRNSAT